MGERQKLITPFRYRILKRQLDYISEVSGLENRLHHLLYPDTDMNDKICENLQDSKICIVKDLNRIKEKVDELIKKILAL